MRSPSMWIPWIVLLFVPALAADDPQGAEPGSGRLELRPLYSATVDGAPSVPTITAPASFSLSLEGDLELGGFVFKGNYPFIHSDGEFVYSNTALGLRALESLTLGVPTPLSSGRDNTAVGFYALRTNTSGSMNTGIGAFALRQNSTGVRNTAVGESALLQNTEGFENSALGRAALAFNDVGDQNTAVGIYALVNNNGSSNTAVGRRALFTNTTYGFNTAVGADALFFNTGASNTAVGHKAGYGWTDGSNNIALGTGAEGLAGETATIRIGGGGLQTTTHIEGIAGGSVAGDPVCVTADGELGECPQVSSHRFKHDIRSADVAGDTLSALRPVSFRYRPEVLGEAEPILRYGLIAEEVAAVLPHLVSYDEEGNPYKVRYEMLAPLLLTGVQRHNAAELRHENEFETLLQQVADQRDVIADLRRRLEALERERRGPDSVPTSTASASSFSSDGEMKCRMNSDG